MRHRRSLMTAACIATLAAACATATARDLSIITWNVDGGSADPNVIARRMAGMRGTDLWGLSEVANAGWLAQFEIACGHEGQATCRSILGTTGSDDRLGIIYDTTKLELREHRELHHIRPGSRAPAPLVGHFRYLPTGDDFLFVVSHLDRLPARARHDQARMLNEWGATQSLPIILARDMDFDWSVSDIARPRNLGFDLLAANDVFRWLQPERLVSTEDANGASTLDCIFVSGPEPWSDARCRIIVEPGDFPDDQTTSDHRPVAARFVFQDAGSIAVTADTGRMLREILQRLERIEAELAELRRRVDELERKGRLLPAPSDGE